ncbi:MAG TPA: RICIN domain-containing protein [Kofleriaceae bacterium]|nr:RICIN domain-containing protein [Kofleriaceae bacterium]
MRSTIIATLALSLAGCIVDEELPTETGAAELVIPSQPTTLVRDGSGKCLDVNAAGNANGTKIQQWACNGTPAQTFTLEDRGGGNYRFRNPSSDKCLEVAGGGTANGTKIQLWTCSSSSNQKFKVQELAGGKVRVRHTASNKCMDVNAGSNADGAKVQIWSCNDSAAQSWSFGGGSTPPPPPPPPPPGDLQWRNANLTNFTSYPDPGSDECENYNGCMWAGYFAFVDGQMPESWVSSHNIAAVHSRDASAYALKTLRLRQGSRQLDVTVYDMCSDSDCDGCCTRNASETGFLIDIESYTMQRFGSGDGIVQWACLDCN